MKSLWDTLYKYVARVHLYVYYVHNTCVSPKRSRATTPRNISIYVIFVRNSGRTPCTVLGGSGDSYFLTSRQITRHNTLYEEKKLSHARRSANRVTVSKARHPAQLSSRAREKRHCLRRRGPRVPRILSWGFTLRTRILFVLIGETNA